MKKQAKRPAPAEAKMLTYIETRAAQQIRDLSGTVKHLADQIAHLRARLPPDRHAGYYWVRWKGSKDWEPAKWEDGEWFGAWREDIGPVRDDKIDVGPRLTPPP